MTKINSTIQRISGRDLNDLPGACDDNFNNIDKRLCRLEDEFDNIDNKLRDISDVVSEIKDCVKPRLAEFGVRIGNIESFCSGQNQHGINGRYVFFVMIGAAIAGGGSGKLMELLIKLFG